MLTAAALGSCALIVAACGGGGGSAVPAGGGTTSTTQSKIALAFAGTSTLSGLRATKSLAGTTITVTYNGATVGTGSLDSTGAATITLTSPVPAGSTVLVTAGTTTISFVVASATTNTAVFVQVNPDGTLTVTTSGGTQPTASPAPGDPDGSTSTEDKNGTPTIVNDNDGKTTLPSNLPIVVTDACSTVTVAPASGKSFARLRFEENVHDGEGGSKLKYDGAFNGPMSFPLVSQAARLHIQLFDANHHQVLELQAPIGAFTATSVTASPSPSASPSALPSASPAASPSPSSSPSAAPCPSTSPAATATPIATASPVPTASPTP